jgi:hypothetical protein
MTSLVSHTVITAKFDHFVGPYKTLVITKGKPYNILAEQNGKIMVQTNKTGGFFGWTDKNNF